MRFLSALPMFGYNIDKNTREKMYSELNARRAAIAASLSDEDDEEL